MSSQVGADKALAPSAARSASGRWGRAKRLGMRQVRPEQIARVLAQHARSNVPGNLGVGSPPRRYCGSVRWSKLTLRPSVTVMRIGVALLAAFALLVLPATAIASLADEQQQGQDLIAQLGAGTRTCGDLSAEDFDHIGEYVMYRAAGSTNVHQAINDRMTAMMGEGGETRMHQLLGQRLVGCNTGGRAGTSVPGGMGPGMMGGSGVSGGWGAMMGSGDWSWMMSGAWHMTRQDWQRLEQRLLGADAVATNRGGWGLLAIIGVTLGVVLLVALGVFAVLRRPFRRPRPAAASHQ